MSGGGSSELRDVMNVDPFQDWDSKICIHHVNKMSPTPHHEYVNVDPKK